jgi:hypothetical protein
MLTVLDIIPLGLGELFQAGQKGPETRRAKIGERRRTLQYVERSRSSATKYMGLYGRPAEAR